jgi:hypothetical protein
MGSSTAAATKTTSRRTEARSSVSIFASLLALLAAAACSGSSPQAERPEAPRAALHEGPLTDYAVAAGLQWLVVADLKALSKEPRIREAVGSVVSDRRLEEYAAYSGVDLRRASAALVAAYPLSMLYVVETRGSEVEIERRFIERVDPGPVRANPHPRVRLLQGVIGGYPRTLVTAEGRFAAWSDGDPAPARAAGLYAAGRLATVPSALEGAAFMDLPKNIHDAPIRAYAAGPFEGAWAGAAQGALSGATGVAVAARPVEDELHVRVALGGDWEPEDIARVEAAWTRNASSQLGSLQGLSEPAAAPRTVFSERVLEWSTSLRLKPLLDGLYAAVGAQVDELMRSVDRSEGPPEAGEDRKNRMNPGD